MRARERVTEHFGVVEIKIGLWWRAGKASADQFGSLAGFDGRCRSGFRFRRTDDGWCRDALRQFSMGGWSGSLMAYTFTRNQISKRLTQRFVRYQGTHLNRDKTATTEDNESNLVDGSTDDPLNFAPHDFHPVGLAQQ